MSNGSRPKLLDLFCGAGGASYGYHLSGFDVVGVDIRPQPNYPFAFVQADAMTFDLSCFDYIHASPPCQKYSTLNARTRYKPRLDLIASVRQRLIESGAVYIIENVPQAPLRPDLLLCGTMFSELRVIRHRIFESNVPLHSLPHGPHPLVFTHDKRKAHYGALDQNTSFVQVTGGGNCTYRNACDAMGIDWMTKDELNEAIPPAYAQFIGAQLLAAGPL